MTQPKRTASRLLSALLGLIMLLSLLPTVTLAAERVPEELKAIKVTSDIEEIAQFRHPVQMPTFKETTGKPVKFQSNRKWVRLNEATGAWEDYTEKTFKEGKYKFYVMATISGNDFDQYRFANKVTVTVNGTEWITGGTGEDPGSKVSRFTMISPEYTIEGRQLVNRIVLTSNMEEILAQKEGLDTPYIQVRSAFTTTGTKVSCVDKDVSPYDWQVKNPDGVFWLKAWDPDDFRPGVQRGDYYRLVFTVEIKYNDRDTYALVEPDQLTVTLDGAECRVIRDVEGKHGAEMKVLTREYYAPPLDELKSITSIDLKTSIPNILQAYNSMKKPSIRETKDKMVFRADSYEDGWQHGVARVLPNNGGLQYKWEEPTTSYFKKDNVYRYGAVLTVKDWEHWKLGVANTLTVTVDGKSIPRENIKRLDDFHVLVYSEKHQARERTPIEEVNVTSNIASIVKLGGTVQTPTITFNDGNQDLYIDGSIGFGWLRWEDSDWYTYEKGEFEPGKYCYYTNVHVRNWEDYAFSDNVTVNWDGKPCDRPTGRAPSQIFVSSPVYIVPETVKVVTITSNIKDILKVGGEVKTPTITTEEDSYVYTQPVWTYEWERKIGPGNSDADWEVYQKSTFEAGTYRYNIHVNIRNPEEFKLAGKDELTVKWDGAVCNTFHHSDRSVWVESGEYTISSAPANVTLGAAKAVSNGIQVTWQAADGAAKYNVYRKDAVNTKWKAIATVTGTSYTDKSGTAGTKYSYTVRGVGSDGKTLSPGFDRTGVSATMPAVSAAPANVTLTGAKAVSGGIQVTWQAASGAAKYNVYRKDAVNTKWTVIATVTGTSYTDKSGTAGTKYSYTVRGVAADGKTLSPGYNKTGVSATMPAASATPANVTLGNAKAVSGGIQVTWQAANGAAKYKVYRKDAANTKWTVIATVAGTSYTDKSGTAGTKYSYTVRGVAADGKTLSPGYNKTGVSATMPAASATPAKVVLVSAKADSAGILVTWQNTNGAHAYQVYRKDAVNTKWTVIAKNVRDTEWKDITAVKGTKYTYTVRAVADDGVTLGGYDSAGKSAMVTASPTTPANVTLGTATAGKNGIVVTWSYAADARTYRVYRKAPGDTKWVAVAHVNGKSWTDKNVTSGVKYSYTVRGVNANGKLSPGYNKTGVSTIAK